MTSLNALIKANALQGDEAFIVLAKFEHSSLATPLRLARNNAPIVHNGDTYVPFGFDIELPESNNSIDEARLFVDPVAMPSEPAAVLGESIAEGGNTLANAPINPRSVVVKDGSTVVAEDDGGGNFTGATVDAGSGINYSTGVLDILLTPNPSGALTVDYEWFVSGESFVSVLRSISPVDGPIEVTITFVLEGELNTAQLEWTKMRWTGIGVTTAVLEGKLRAKTTLNDPLQERGRRFTPNNFPALF